MTNAKYIRQSREPKADVLRDDGLYERDVAHKAASIRRYKKKLAYNKEGLAFLINLCDQQVA